MNKDKIVFWLSENRKKIGYTLGAINLVDGLYLFNIGELYGVLFIVTGVALIFDSWSTP